MAEVSVKSLKKNYGAVEVIHGIDVDIADGELIVSSIYSWFKADFGSSDEAVIAHLIRYAKPSLADKLSKIDEIEDDQYDWKLNIAN